MPFMTLPAKKIVLTANVFTTLCALLKKSSAKPQAVNITIHSAYQVQAPKYPEDVDSRGAIFIILKVHGERDYKFAHLWQPNIRAELNGWQPALEAEDHCMRIDYRLMIDGKEPYYDRYNPEKY